MVRPHPKPSAASDDDAWDEVLRIFKPPWKIVRRENGAIRIENAMQRLLVYIYHRKKNATDWEKPTEEEALVLARAIARMSIR
jgi:hypothetical protein